MRRSLSPASGCRHRSMATNSSPPNRATVPPGNASRIRLAISISTSSPALCPCRSLISLKRSRSMAMTASLACRRQPRGGRPGLQLALETSRRLGKPVGASVLAMRCRRWMAADLLWRSISAAATAVPDHQHPDQPCGHVPVHALPSLVSGVSLRPDGRDALRAHRGEMRAGRRRHEQAGSNGHPVAA